MKTVFISLMLGSYAGLITSLVYGFIFFYEHWCLASITLWILSYLSLAVGIVSFIYARKFGLEDDKIKRLKDSEYREIGSQYQQK